jgi:hypothetical protein
MALTKITAEGVDLTDDFSFTGTVTGAGAPFIFFEAQLTSDQSLAQNSNTSLAFNNVITDTANAYTSGTYRYTPSTAGYWFMKGQTLLRSNSVFGSRHYFLNMSIRKNGSPVRDFIKPKETSNTDSDIGSEVTAILYANGTTDYFDITHYHYDYGAQASITAQADTRRCYFTGYYLGDA